MAIKVFGTNRVIAALSKGIEKYVKRTENATMKAGLKAEYFAKKILPLIQEICDRVSIRN